MRFGKLVLRRRRVFDFFIRPGFQKIVSKQLIVDHLLDKTANSRNIWYNQKYEANFHEIQYELQHVRVINYSASGILDAIKNIETESNAIIVLTENDQIKKSKRENRERYLDQNKTK